jgi:hypothetical protein
MRDPEIVPSAPEPEPAELDDELPEAGTTFALPAPGRERLYGGFDGIPSQVATARNLAARRRVIE